MSRLSVAASLVGAGGGPEWNIAETFAFVRARASGSFVAARVAFRTTRCVNK